MLAKKSVNKARMVLMASVKDAPFKCPTCKKVFISDIHLRRHKERRHNFKSVPSPAHKEKKDLENAANDGPTITAVLNATERIEDLLVKLTVKETEKYNLPLACSSLRNVVEDDSFTALSTSSPEKSVTEDENDIKTSNDNLKLVPKIKCYPPLKEEENEELWRLSSSGVETRTISYQVLNPIVNIVNKQQNGGKINIIDSLEEISHERSSSNCQSSFRSKEELIQKLNIKLKSYGINPNQETLSDLETSRIGQLLESERDQIAESVPEYFELRELINGSAERRIQGNLQSQNIYIT